VSVAPPEGCAIEIVGGWLVELFTVKTAGLLETVATELATTQRNCRLLSEAEVAESV
jgi:hypothetical protein